MVARSGTSIHGDGDVPEAAPLAAIRWDVADRSDYAFCSARRPAYAFPDGGGGLLVHFLDLHDLAGYQLASAGLYMRLCHGRSAVPDAEGLRRLGYAPGTRSEQIEGQSLDSLTRF